MFPAFSLEPRAARGFSLVELAISIGILSVGLVGAIRVFPVGLRASQRAEVLSRATLVGERTLELLKLNSWEELGQMAQEGSTTVEGSFEVTVIVDEPVVEGVIDPSRLKRIAVRVSWIQEGRLRSLTLLTYRQQPSTP